MTDNSASPPQRYAVRFIRRDYRGQLAKDRAFSHGWKPASFKSLDRALVRMGALFAASAAEPTEVYDRVTFKPVAWIGSDGRVHT